MAMEKIVQYGCRVCGRRFDVTKTGDVYEEPVYCCGMEATVLNVPEVSSAQTAATPKKKPAARKKAAKKKIAKKAVKKAVKKKAMKKKAIKKKASVKKAAKKKAKKTARKKR